MEPFSSLVELLAKRAARQPDARAYVFLSDRGAEEAAITFGQLHDAANALAARLRAVARPGERALLVFPPGLEFIVAFFGCLIARVIAVPMMMPRRQSARDASAAIMANCEPAVALSNAAFAIREDLQARFLREGLQWLPVQSGFLACHDDKTRTAGARAARHRLPAIHVGFHDRTQGCRRQPRQSAGQSGNDPLRARQYQPIDLRQLGAALPRYGTDPEHAANALCRIAVRPDGAERLHPAAAALAARHP